MKFRKHPTADALADFFFRCSLFLFPANAAFSVGAFGEIGSEPYLLLNIFTILLLLVSGAFVGVWKSSIVGFLFFVTFVVICFVGFLFNYEYIAISFYKDKSGVSRFLSGIMIPLWGSLFSVLVFYFSRNGFQKNIVRPLYFGSFLVVFFAFFEIASWQSDAIRTAYLPFTNVIHALMRRGESVIGRVQSITYEASNFGFYVCLVVPLFICFSKIKEVSDNVGKIKIITGLLVSFSLFSGRTSFFGVLLALGFSLLFVKIALYPSRYRGILKILILSIPGAIIFLPLSVMAFNGDYIVSLIYDSDNLSNVSRYSTIYSQVEIFLDNVFLGVGLNQYGYYYPTYVPAWADNWETNAWIYDLEASFFPSFSLYSRVAAELGLIGLLFVFSVIQYVYSKSIGFVFSEFTNIDLRILSAGVAAGIVALCFVLWTVGTFRIFNFWFLLGLFCYIRFRVENESSARRAIC